MSAHPAVLALAAATAFLLLIPPAQAWSLPSAPPAEPPGVDVAAWTTDLAPGAAGALGSLQSAVGCALGDVTGDGVADLLVLVTDPSSSVRRLEALAGPGFTTVVWQKVSSASQVLSCAADVDVDGALDPILSTVGAAAGSAASGAGQQTTMVVQQVLAGASGVAMVGRTITDTTRGAASSAGAVAQTATGTLLPAAAGATALLQTQATGALAGLPSGLPLGALDVTAASSATLQVLDVTGAVVSTVKVDTPGIEPLAMAPLQLTGALPNVAVLSSTLTPVAGAAAGVPQIALYAADGTLAWSKQLTAAAGSLPVLLPQAGDLDLDGVGDLIVATVPQATSAATQVASAASTGFQVLSGVDGHTILASAAGAKDAAVGLLTALPLGTLPGGPAILQVAAKTAGGALSLSALGATGKVLWSVDVPGMAVPVNAALDAYTHDIQGFTDLTGDAVPDVAVAVQTTQGLALRTIDGATGQLAWATNLTGIAQASNVIPVVRSAAQHAGDVATAAVGQTTALVAVGAQAGTATLRMLDAATGKVLWTATAALPVGADPARLDLSVAGDLDKDGVQDLLVSAAFNGTSGSHAMGGGAASAGSGPAPDTTVTAVSGSSGQTLYKSSDGSQPVAFTAGGGPAASSSGAPAKGSPGFGAVGALAVLAVAAWAWRRRS